MAKKYLREKGMEAGIVIVSAGIAAWPGSGASSQSIEVMETKGIDLTEHRAQFLTLELANEADLILTMTRSHKQHIVQMAPNLLDRTYTLKEYVLLRTGEPGDVHSRELDIQDPFGCDMTIYSECAGELETNIAIALDKYLEEIAKTEDGQG